MHGAAQPTVLVVDDNPITRRMSRAALAAAGYGVLEAGDAATALRVAGGTTLPDLVLLDLMLPDMPGYDAVTRLRALPGGAELPIVALCGLTSQVEQIRALEAGFNDYVFKPMEPTRLVQIVAAQLPAKPRADAAEKAGSGRRALVVDDDPIQLKLTRAHLKDAGFEVATAADGEEGLEAARRVKPDVVVSDVLMPRMDGFRFCLTLKRDPALHAVPVVLASSAFVQEADMQLARQVGAHGLVLRAPDHRAVVGAVLAALQPGAPLRAADAELDPGEYTERIVRQLERQMQLSAVMAQRLAQCRAEMAILTAAAASVGRGAEPAAVLEEILGRSLDAAGLSRGAAYLRPGNGSLVLAAHHGHAAEVRSELGTFFGHPEVLDHVMAREEPLRIPGPEVTGDRADRILSGAGARSMLLVRIGSPDPLGVIWMGSTDDRSVGEEWLLFAGAIAAQISSAVTLARAMQQARAAELQYRGIFDNAVEGIFQLSPGGRLLTANPAMARLLGYGSPRELLEAGVGLEAVLADRAGAEGFLGRLAGHGLVSGYEARARRRDGGTVWISLSARAVLDADGRLLRHEGYAEDVTERRRADELAKLEALRRQQLQIKDEFLSHVSHELRTPLAAIHQFMTILLDGLAGPLSDAQRVPAASVLRNVQHLRTMIDDLLEATRAHAGPLAVAPRPCALPDVVSDAVRTLQPAADERGVALSLRAPRGLPPALADPDRVAQILINLIGNAVKFTPRGGRVEVSVAAFGGGMLRVSVIDTGPGIPVEERSRIFDYLYQGKNVAEISRKGFGIGLYLSRELVTRQGGRIWVESGPASGSAFHFTLPATGPAGQSGRTDRGGHEIA